MMLGGGGLVVQMRAHTHIYIVYNSAFSHVHVAQPRWRADKIEETQQRLLETCTLAHTTRHTQANERARARTG